MNFNNIFLLYKSYDYNAISTISTFKRIKGKGGGCQLKTQNLAGCPLTTLGETREEAAQNLPALPSGEVMSLGFLQKNANHLQVKADILGVEWGFGNGWKFD